MEMEPSVFAMSPASFENRDGKNASLFCLVQKINIKFE